MQIKQRLDSLTSLRFFAAAMIVVHHTISYGLFGLSEPQEQASIWGQGVSFFFVLSGFILAYVYPNLETWPEIRRFWLARIARVWPALAFSFIFAFWLLSLDWDSPIALTNLLMINAWIPYQDYFFSYNSPSWSVSTEFFFYLAFPFLIFKFDNNRVAKLLISFLILLIMFVLSNMLQAKTFGNFDDTFAKTGLLYISPASRIFEFIFGMYISSVWKKNINIVKWGQSRATFYEVASILVVGASMYLIPVFGEEIRMTLGEKAASYWLSFSGSMFAFGLLIYVISIGRGWVSAWLSHPALVLLGEISFSLYLLHQVLLRYFHANIIAFPHLPNVLSLIIFWTFLLLASYLTWAFVEMPSRQMILHRMKIKIHATNVMQKSWRNHLNLNRKTGSAAIAMGLLVSSIYFSMDHSASVYLQRKNIPISANSLSFYSAHGDLQMVRLLIEAGVDVNEKNNQGSTALIEASWAGEAEVALTLLNVNADVNMLSSSMLTALSAASNQKKESVSLLLLTHGANPNIVDQNGSSLLMHAAWQGNLTMLKELLARGANPNYKSPEGFTALKAAASNRNTDVVRALEYAGATE